MLSRKRSGLRAFALGRLATEFTDFVRGQRRVSRYVDHARGVPTWPVPRVVRLQNRTAHPP